MEHLRSGATLSMEHEESGREPAATAAPGVVVLTAGPGDEYESLPATASLGRGAGAQRHVPCGLRQGVLFLQYGDDIKQLRMPNEITSTDTIRALFVSAFPQLLTMKVLESPNVAIYIKDENRNIYYELNDVRNIQDRCLLKVYNKDPAQAFNHTPRPANGDMRMQREIAYTGREGPPLQRTGSATHPYAAPNSPPTTPISHSMPASPSRIPYGGARPLSGQGNVAVPKERLVNMPASRSISPSPSAILERRDVKPDEDLSNKNVQLLRNEGMYADPYMFHDGRMSVASSHTGHPLDMPDHIFAYHRGAMRSSSTYSNSAVQSEMMEQSMYRQKSRKYTETHLPNLGSKTPPSSPHRVTDIRLVEHHVHNTHVPPHAIQSDRSSPIRQSFKKESGPPLYMEATMTKARNAVGLQSMADVIPSVNDKQAVIGYGPAAPPKETYTRERMQAMEKQIASLTGLVQSALFKGPAPVTAVDSNSEKMTKTASNVMNSAESGGSSYITGGKNTLTLVESTTLVNHLPPSSSVAVHGTLQDMRRNVSDLRLQLYKMRQLQLQNQDMLRAMVKKAELEINSRVIETVKRLEDPVQRQRVLVEQERQNYLHEEETLVKKISDLEGFVDDLKKDSTPVNKGVTLKDVEDGAFSLRQIGEAVANLKGAFPPLQNKMRAVLRVEVEAVRFLKEEPHKLDSLLKRIRNMTDALTALRRHVTDGVYKETDPAHKVQYTFKEKSSEADTLRTHEEVTRTHSASQQNAPGVAPESKASSLKSEPFSTMTIHHVQSSPVVMHQSQHSSALVPHPLNSPSTTYNSVGLVQAGDQVSSTPGTPQESVTAMQPGQTAPSPPVNGSSTQGFFIHEIHHASFRNRVVSIEEAEKKWEEKRQNLDHYNGKEFEKLLEEAQANIMKSIPSLEVPPQSPKTETVETLEVFEEATTDVEQEHDKIMKSPPPPPPRRIYPPGSGISSTRTAEVTQTIKKDNTKELNEDVSPTLPAKVSRSQSDEQTSHPTTPVVADSVTKEDDEQEGERIMAELQKYSFMDVNSKGHAEQPRIDTQVKEMRPVGLMQLKEKKNLDFVQEEVKKSDDGYEKTSTAEYSRVAYYVTTGMEHTQHTQEIVENVQDNYQEQRDRPRESESQMMAGNTIVSLTHKHSTFNKDFTEEDSKIVTAVREPPSGDSCSADTVESREQQTAFRVQSPVFENVKVEYTHRVHSPVEIVKMESTNRVQSPVENEKVESTYRVHSPVENEKVRINYRVSSVVSESTSPNELTIVDGFTKVSDDSSPDDDSKIQDLLLAAKTLRERELPFLDSSQQVVLRPKASKNRNVHINEDVTSPSTSPSTSPTDNIAFMITQNEVQVLSSGEVHDIVSRQGDDIQTVNIDARADKKNQNSASENSGNEDPVLCMDKKPVIIIFDEPMDIRSAYKRLSTIFEECEEEFDRMMSGQKILEEDEDEDLEMSSTSEVLSEKNKDVRYEINNQSKLKYKSYSNPLKPLNREEEETTRKHLRDSDDINSGIALDSPDDQYANRDDVKKKFKFKFPKKQLAALTQAIRTGTKTGKKTLQVVVYEDEEEPDGTVKQHKEAKRFEITRSKSKEEAAKIAAAKQQQQPSEMASLPARTDEIRKNTYRTLDSLEQTIKQLENTISEMSPKAVSEMVGASEENCALQPSSPVQINETSKQGEPKTRVESPSSIPTAPRKVSSGSSQTSRMPIPMASKSRQQGTVEKTGKQPKLQEPQRQYRQANGGTKKAGGDFKATSPTLTSSKIPAFSPTSGKGSSLPAYCGESPNALSPPTKSPISSSNPLSPPTGRPINSSSLIPSIPNGSSKNPNNPYAGKGHPLSFSPQTANGRPSPSSSSSSPTTPTTPLSLGQGMKNIRTIHTPSLTSYKSQNGNARKVTTATTKEPS